MAQDVRRQLRDVGRQRVPATTQEGEGAGTRDQVDRATRTGAIADVRREVRGAPILQPTGGLDQANRVADDPRVDEDVLDPPLQRGQAVGIQDLAGRLTGA